MMRDEMGKKSWSRLVLWCAYSSQRKTEGVTTYLHVRSVIC